MKIKIVKRYEKYENNFCSLIFHEFLQSASSKSTQNLTDFILKQVAVHQTTTSQLYISQIERFMVLIWDKFVFQTKPCSSL